MGDDSGRPKFIYNVAGPPKSKGAEPPKGKGAAQPKSKKGAEQPKGKGAGQPKGKGFLGTLVGGVAGGCEACLSYPLEYTKTQLQLDEKGDRKMYNGILDVMQKTVKQRGFFGLYRGFSIILCGTVPQVSTRFGVFEAVKGILLDDEGNLSLGGRFFSGLCAGAGEALVAVTPMETIKTKFINDLRSPTPQYKGLLHGIKTIAKAHGFMGLYQGLTPTVLKHSTNQGMRFLMMETMKDKYRGGDPDTYIPKYIIAAMACFSAVVSVVANNPIDVIKTRMQGLEASRYKNTLDCMQKMLAQEGVKSFYQGTIPRICRISLDTTITFTVYDTIVEIVEQVWK